MLLVPARSMMGPCGNPEQFIGGNSGRQLFHSCGVGNLSELGIIFRDLSSDPQVQTEIE